MTAERVVPYRLKATALNVFSFLLFKFMTLFFFNVCFQIYKFNLLNLCGAFIYILSEVTVKELVLVGLLFLGKTVSPALSWSCP